VGVGVVPSAWYSGAAAVQFGTGGSFFSNNIEYNYSGANIYYNGTNWAFMGTGRTALFSQAAGQHIWQYSASGFATQNAWAYSVSNV
jgi:outer membrane protein assembly factor BamB